MLAPIFQLAILVTVPHLLASATLELCVALTRAALSSRRRSVHIPRLAQLFKVDVNVRMFRRDFPKIADVVEHARGLFGHFRQIPVPSSQASANRVGFHFENERFGRDVSTVGQFDLREPLTEAGQRWELVDDDLVQVLL